MNQASPLRELADYRELLWMLAWRDVRVRYKHTLMGAAWAVAPPLATMLVFVFVFRHAMGLTQLSGGSDLPYPLFAMSGLVPWTFLTSGLTGALVSLVSNRTLVTKIYFPREVFPLAALGSAAADFLVAMAVLGGLIAYYNVATPWTFHASWSLLWLPGVIAVQVMLMAGVGFFLAMANLYYRDVGFIVRTALPLLMFVTNVVYPLQSANRTVEWVIRLNPMVPILDAYRAAIFGDAAFPAASFGYAVAVALLLLVTGWATFHRSEHAFAEVV